MTIPESLTSSLLPEIDGLHSKAILTRLAELGVLCLRRCEQQAIRTEVMRLTRMGSGRCEAMEQTALQFHCSYAKVRQAVYYKPKK